MKIYSVVENGLYFKNQNKKIKVNLKSIKFNWKDKINF